MNAVWFKLDTSLGYFSEFDVGSVQNRVPFRFPFFLAFPTVEQDPEEKLKCHEKVNGFVFPRIPR